MKHNLLKFIKLGWGGVYKTLYYNFKLLPFRQAIHLPIILSGKTIIKNTERGSVMITTDSVHYGILTIGVSHREYSFEAPNFVKIEGKLIIHGSGYHHFGPGGNLTVKHSGIFEIGNNFSIGHFSKFVVAAHSIIGDNNLHSWENLYMDTDSHPIYDASGKRLNYPRGFHIGNNVWVGARCTVLKGVHIAEGSILASRSLVTKNLETPGSIYASSRLIKSNIHWDKTIG